jgi:hypothetical protein
MASRKGKSPRITWLLLLIAVYSNVGAASLHGFVRVKSSKEPVIMANIWLQDTKIGVLSNLKGYYVLPQLPAGTYKICFRLIGYKMTIIEQNLAENDDVEVNALLEPESIQMQEVTVKAQREKGDSEIKPSQIMVETPQLRYIPQVAEPDLFRALQMLPGVATLSDFSAGLYIRGGSPDQNLILLDQIDVYNPNHLFGFFSTFNSDAVKSVELLKGGFPAAYGGRLSSVLNVFNKEGNREQVHGVTRLSLLSGAATIEGPWKKGSWMISGRRTYLDAAAQMVDKDLPYYFYDGHGRINYDIDKNNMASVSFYLGKDLLDMSKQDTKIQLDWGNQTFSTQWTHLFSTKLFSHFVFAGSRFTSNAKVKFDKVGFGQTNSITDLSLKGQLTWSPTSFHSMDFGFETKQLGFKLNYDIVDSKYRNTFSGNYAALFCQDNFKLNNLNIFQAGVRAEYYSDGDYLRLGPRLSYKRLLTDLLDMTVSYGRYHQFLNQVTQEGMSFADMWFPVDRSFKPGSADHYIIGLNYDNKRSFSISVEGYYKDYDHIAEYRTFRAGDESLENQTAAQNFYSGKGKSYGADVYLRNHFWGFQGWLGYSLSWTKKQVDGYNFSEEYYPTYDRRHSITVIEDYRLSEKWRLNIAFKYGSGQPYTEATARYLAMNPDGATHYEALDGKKNFYRLPAYHRLDLGLYYSTTVFKLPAEFFIQVINAYNQKNVWYRYYQVNNNPATVKDFTQIPLLPTFGLTINF